MHQPGAEEIAGLAEEERERLDLDFLAILTRVLSAGEIRLWTVALDRAAVSDEWA